MSPAISDNSSHQPSSTVNSGGLQRKRQQVDHDVIDISSSEYDSQSIKHMRKENTTRTPARTYIPSSGVIEISSDDEQTSSPQAVIGGLQKQLKKIREACVPYPSYLAVRFLHLRRILREYVAKWWFFGRKIIISK
ncbi:hypothetical protein BDQ17DRAFT_1330547 [Cyathus striatus]|nr:hypothetical protein BDQ17DRAFT_1330547 [Cyathus striatus]